MCDAIELMEILSEPERIIILVPEKNLSILAQLKSFRGDMSVISPSASKLLKQKKSEVKKIEKAEGEIDEEWKE